MQNKDKNEENLFFKRCVWGGGLCLIWGKEGGRGDHAIMWFGSSLHCS